VSMIILGLNKWSFQRITNFMNYIINIQSYQNTHLIQIPSCLRAFPLLWNVASAREWDFTAQQFWWSWVFAHLRENIADDAMQMDVHKTLYLFYTTKKMLHVTVTITKNASLAAIARYISITKIYTVGYQQIFNIRHFCSSKHCPDL